MTTKLFNELGLSEDLLKAIDKLGFEQASPIQAAAIPELLAGHDVVGQSQTGSGKTAAFAIPAIEKADAGNRTVQSLILCPTRELAVQISEEVHKLALFKRGIHVLPIYGGQSYDRQLYGLRQGVQIVIGTPGRVMDHMRRGTLRLDTVKFAVLDEVDVMLNMGFRDDIEAILEAAPKERQTVFFSATIARPIRQLIEKFSRGAREIRIEQKTLTVPTVEQLYYEVDPRNKLELLERLIDIHDLKLGLVFCNTKRMVDELADRLEQAGYMADRLHGDMTQAMRDRVMNKFRKSGLEFLVATDVAARGIDVDDIEVVFNYDLPYDVEDYVHRIGRTGRAGRKGRAISFVAGREMFQIRNIERFTNTRVHRGRIPTAGEVAEARRTAFLDKVRATLQQGKFEQENALVGRLLEEGHASTDIAAACLVLLRSGESSVRPPAKETSQSDRPSRPAAPSIREERGVRDARSDRPDRRPERGSEVRSERRPDARSERRPEARPDRSPETRFERKSETRPERRPEVRSERSFEPRPERPSAPRPERKPEPQPERTPDEVRIERPSAPPAEAPKVVPVVRVSESPEKQGSNLRRPALPPKKKVRKQPEPAWVTVKRGDPKTMEKAKASRATPADQVRLWMNIGESMSVGPVDIVQAIAGETGLPSKVVGTVDLRERHLFVDVAKEHAKGIVSKLNRSNIKGHKIKVKVA